MNRSFRDSPQLQIQAAVIKQRQQLMASMAKEREEEQLALFLEMKRSGIDQNDLLLLNSNPDDFDAPLGTSPIFNISSSAVTMPARRVAGDDFLNSDNDKNDYDWLLTPPGTPLFPSLEMESQKTIMSQLGTPKARPSLISRLANPESESTRSTLLSKQSTSSPSLSSSGMRGPSSSGGSGSRPSTPTFCPTLSTTAKPSWSSTPTSRATLPSKPTVSTSKPVAPIKPSATAGRFGSASVGKPTVPARSSTPTRSAPRSSTPTTRSSTPTRSAPSSSTPTARSSTPTRSAPSSSTPTVRSSTPTRSAPRSSTPTPRSSVPPPKSTSRAATPTQRPSTPASAPSVTSASVRPSPSVSKPSPSVSKPSPSISKPSPSVSKPSSAARNPVPSHGTSPTEKSRPWKPSDMPGFSHDAPPNLRTSVSGGPLSATRGRPGVPSSRSSSIEPAFNGRPRRQSCSPSRGRTPNGILHSNGSSVPASNRLHAKANDNVSPGLMGTKMVERVVNMRRLIPPRQDDKLSPRGNLSGKSSSPDSSGFGRTLSKKSLDMAIRHMDIRRTIPGNLRPLMSNIPASSMYSVRSGATRSRTVSISDSPVATSSNASSEVSINNIGVYLDGFELENEIGGERGGRSPLRTR